MRQKMQRNGNWGLRGISGCLAVCLLLALILAGCGKRTETTATEDPGREIAATTVPEETQAELSVTDLLKAVVTLKDDMKSALDDIKSNDLDAAKSKIEDISGKTATIRESISLTMESLGDSLPSMQAQLENIQKMLNLVDMASEKILVPTIDQIQKNPLSEMRVGDGISTKGICGYLDFMESLMPDIEILVEQAKSIDMSLVDSEGKIAEYLETANDLLEMYHKDSSVFALLKSIFGADEDRLYLIAAQNSAEIRASGGFPGAMGTMRIQDGVLILEEFKKVYSVLASYTPAEANVTSTESRLFHGGLTAPRDADFCPDFERVAYIWSLGYESAQKEPLDGVISVTPAIVQKLLAAMDEEVKLFDGTVLNGENAVKVLQHDLYFKYFGNDYVANRAEIADQLFADAAKKTMEKLLENLEIFDLTAYLSVAKEGFQDRTLMLWMNDEAEQSIISQLGWSGGLNTDPENPQAGIYYNCTIASKMGWFLIMDTQIGERVENEDGSYTYPVTVTFSNDITTEEIKTASSYITGGKKGAIVGSAYFFAPAGGTVSDFVASNGVNIRIDTYHDLQLGYMGSFYLTSSSPVTVTYHVTTAPGVDTPLTISQTPTVQDYH